MSQPVVRIRKPCTENWNLMTPAEQGRHCAVCAKTVVDFTTWPPEDIRNYLRKHSAAKVCGRFTAAQAVTGLPQLNETPVQVAACVAASPLSFMRKLAAILLISLLVSLNSCAPDKTQGEVQEGIVNAAADTTAPLAGKPVLQPQQDTAHPDTLKERAALPCRKPRTPATSPGQMVGEPIYEVDGVPPVEPPPQPPVKMGGAEIERFPDTAGKMGPQP